VGRCSILWVNDNIWKIDQREGKNCLERARVSEEGGRRSIILTAPRRTHIIKEIKRSSVHSLGYYIKNNKYHHTSS
jgi:hypothetical protein